MAKDKFRKDKTHAIYAIFKGNTTQMLSEVYDTVVDLRKAITQYKCKGFQVKYHIAV